MDNEDLGFVGGALIVISGFTFLAGDTEKYWPYCLGGALFGLALVALSRLLPERKDSED